MSLGQDLAEGPHDKEGQSRCLQTAFSEVTKKPARKLDFDGEVGGRSRKESRLKHQGEGDVLNSEREKLRAVSACGGPCTAAGLASLCAEEKLDERRSGARWESVRLEERRELFLKKETRFSKRSYAGFEKE